MNSLFLNKMKWIIPSNIFAVHPFRPWQDLQSIILDNPFGSPSNDMINAIPKQTNGICFHLGSLVVFDVFSLRSGKTCSQPNVRFQFVPLHPILRLSIINDFKLTMSGLQHHDSAVVNDNGDEEIPWLEHEVHVQNSNKQKNQSEQQDDTFEGKENDVDDDDDDDEGFVRDFVFHMFDKPSDVVYNTYHYNDIVIRGQEELGNSTGLSVCQGSVVLYNFLRKIRRIATAGESAPVMLRQPGGINDSSHDSIDLRGIMEGKTIVELGAGTGLCGLYAAKDLGAASVVMTDGDTSVLKNMRYNVEQNTKVMTDARHSYDGISVYCEQLIWGKREQCDRLVERYGIPNVILAADCLYMAPAVKPFFDTIDDLFRTRSKSRDSHQEEEESQPYQELQILIYVLVSASQVPPSMISEEAERVGFSCSLVDKDIYCYSRYHYR